MAGEIEAKFWLHKLDTEMTEKLGLESIVEYDVTQIRAEAIIMSESLGEKHDFLDNFYQKSKFDHGYTAKDLVSKISFESGIKYGDQFLNIAVESDNDLKVEYNGFIRLLQDFFSLADPDKATTYQIRIREDRETDKTYMTMKYKHGEADDKNEEYEFVVDSREEAEKFLGVLGYELLPDRSKVKHQERYTFDNNGIEVHIEFNSVEQLGGATLLEIEACPRTIDLEVEFVYGIAQSLGIEIPGNNVPAGGNREDRRYQKLIRLANK